MSQLCSCISRFGNRALVIIDRWLWRETQEMPGLLVLGVFGVGAVGGEEDLGPPPPIAKTARSGDPGCPPSGFEREDIPDFGE